eukprot:scaffold111470_cov28-Prasinocladus_malaysianus.AAC.2
MATESLETILYLGQINRLLRPLATVLTRGAGGRNERGSTGCGCAHAPHIVLTNHSYTIIKIFFPYYMSEESLGMHHLDVPEMFVAVF